MSPSNQFRLEVVLADEETECFHVRASQAGTQAGPLERTPELGLLSGITEARESGSRGLELQAGKKPADPGCASDRRDRHTLAPEVPAITCGQRLDGDLVAGPARR